MNVRRFNVCLTALGGLALVLAGGRSQAASIAITEWSYNATGGEYVEFTNVSSAPVDMTGWSEDDNDRITGKHAFGATFGVVQPGQSVILTEATPAAFRSEWNLPASVKIFGPYTDDNLGRSDEINLYDNHNVLVDRLTFNDQGGLGPRTQNDSGNIPLADLGLNNPQSAVLSVVGDSYGSYTNTVGDIGNPGFYAPAAHVPEPATITLVAVAGLAFATRRIVGRRKQRV